MKKYKKKFILVLFLGIFFLAGNTVEAASFVNGTRAIANNNSVTLNALINPNGNRTTAWFEYGTDKNLFSRNETKHIYIGSNNEEIPFSADINKLSPNTVYYFRIVTNNGYKTNRGNILSFSTKIDTIQNNVSYNNTNTTKYVANTRYIERTVPVVYTTIYQNEKKDGPFYGNTKYVYKRSKEISRNSNMANVLSSKAGFLPVTLEDWIVLLFILLIIVVILRLLTKPNTYKIGKTK